MHRPVLFRRLRILMVAGLAMLLAACGARVDTVLTIADDGSGSRVITLTVDQDDLEEYVSGGVEALTATIERHLPDQLTFGGLEESEEAVAAEFTLSFDSPEDYQAKIQTLLTTSGYTSELPDRILTVSQTEFVQGAVVDESFTSRDLMGWLVNGLIADGVIDAGNASDAMESGKTQVSYGGATVDTSAAIDFDKVVDNGMSQIAIHTAQNPDGTWTRAIVYVMPVAAYDNDPSRTDTFLAAATPDGGTLEPLPTAGAGNVGWTLTFAPTAAEDLAALTETATGSPATFSVESATSTTSDLAIDVTVIDYAQCPSICSPDAPAIMGAVELAGDWRATSDDLSASEGEAGTSVLTYEMSNAPRIMTRSLSVASVEAALSLGSALSLDLVFTVDAATADLAGDAFLEFLTPADGGSVVTGTSDDAVTYRVTIDGDDDADFATQLAAFVPEAEFSQVSTGGFLSRTTYTTLTLPLYRLLGEHGPEASSGSVSVAFPHSIDIEGSSAEGTVRMDGGDLRFEPEDADVLTVFVTSGGMTFAALVLIGVGVLLVLAAAAAGFLFRKQLRETFFGSPAQS